MNQKCEHFKDVDEGNTSPNTKGCEECEKEKSDWVALRMCLVCGHVGCCDSSIGLHARKHFEKEHTIFKSTQSSLLCCVNDCCNIHLA